MASSHPSLQAERACGTQSGSHRLPAQNPSRDPRALKIKTKTLVGLVLPPPASSYTTDPSSVHSSPTQQPPAPPTPALSGPQFPPPSDLEQPLNFHLAHHSSGLCPWGTPSLSPRIDRVPPARSHRTSCTRSWDLLLLPCNHHNHCNLPGFLVIWFSLPSYGL